MGEIGMYEAEKARLYSLLEEKTGIKRIIDPRLEKIADDRALEGFYEVGKTGDTPISHPINQLKARTWPLQGTFKGVWENAHWWNQAGIDQVQKAVDSWWESSVHHNNLMNTTATHWGMGIYVNGNAWYFITTFTKELRMRVIIASGEVFPDALTAGPKAALHGSPLLLTKRTSLSPETKEALIRMQPDGITIIGGPGAVSDVVMQECEAIAPTRRFWGENRYGTAVAVNDADWD